MTKVDFNMPLLTEYTTQLEAGFQALYHTSTQVALRCAYRKKNCPLDVVWDHCAERISGRDNGPVLLYESVARSFAAPSTASLGIV